MEFPELTPAAYIILGVCVVALVVFFVTADKKK